MDTMLTFNNADLRPFMTKEEMRVKAPYIFTRGTTNPGTSKRYVPYTTEDVIDDMAKEGWGVVDCRQQRANKNSTVRSFHMVAFQNPDPKYAIPLDNGEIEAYPQIILTNSHDGFNSFKFMVGIFRLVCSNGLILATEQFESISIRHINYSFEELRHTIAASLKKVQQYIEIRNQMRNTVLTLGQKREFAKSALALRLDQEPKELQTTEKELDDLLKPVRDADNGDNLWNTFNVLQEKIVKGLYYHGKTKTGKDRKARPITGPARDIYVNQGLFRQATTYLMAA